MLIVGLQCGHDASVAVVLDGQVLLHLERERESRERHVHWISADIIHDALAYCGLSAADVDFFALCTTQRSGYGTDTPERLRFGYAWETAEKIGVNAFRRTIFDHAASVAATDPYQDGPDLKRVYNTEAPERADAWITPRGMGVIDDIDGDAVRRIFTSPELASTSVVPMTLTLDGRTYPAVGVMHQTAHAAAAFFQSGFETGAVFAFDNGDPRRRSSGHYAGGMLFHGEGNSLRPIWPAPIAAGLIYAVAARVLGLGGFAGPGKLMGLSAYGKPEFHDNRFIGDYDVLAAHYTRPGDDNALPVLGWLEWVQDRANELGYRFDGEAFGPFGKDLAATTQRTFEDLVFYVLDRLQRLLRKAGRMGPNLCLSGGCALNCPTNSRIVEETAFSQVFIPPSCDDGGLSIGAALHLHYHVLGRPRRSAPDLSRNIAALGRAASRPAIDKALEQARSEFEIEQGVNLAERAAEDLVADSVIALFQGRSESGPRALGHRSLLADARKTENWARVNRLKSREIWRPFAPACLSERLREHFDGGPEHSPHMLFNYRVRSRDLGAITHVDGSARVQTVRSGSGPFREIIEEFDRRTGTPVVLNTSLNGRGEPIVETPEQAIELFRRTDIDVLYVEDNRLTKRSK